jgi:hypothetical protein
MYCARLLGVIVKTKAGIWKPGKRIHMQLRSKVGIIRVLAAVLLATAVPFAATDAAERIPVNPLLFGNNLLFLNHEASRLIARVSQDRFWQQTFLPKRTSLLDVPINIVLFHQFRDDAQ